MPFLIFILITVTYLIFKEAVLGKNATRSTTDTSESKNAIHPGIRRSIIVAGFPQRDPEQYCAGREVVKEACLSGSCD
jgi:hypothetical protein